MPGTRSYGRIPKCMWQNLLHPNRPDLLRVGEHFPTPGSASPYNLRGSLGGGKQGKEGTWKMVHCPSCMNVVLVLF